MQDLLITLIAVAPVVMALLAAVAPPKAAWIRPALLPAVLLQLALAAALATRQFLFGYLVGGEPPRALTEAEVLTAINSTTGLGLPFSLAFFAGLTALAAMVAFARERGLKQAVPWAMLAIGAFLVDRTLVSIVQVIAEQPQGASVDLVQLIDAMRAARTPWILPAGIALCLSFPLFTWAGWWGRARWTEGLIPGSLALLVGIPAALASAAYEVGAWTGERTSLNDDQATQATDTFYDFMFGAGLLQVAAALAAVLALLRIVVARRQLVDGMRGLLRGAGWLPLAWCLYCCAALLQEVFYAPSTVGMAMALGTADDLPIGAEFLAVEEALATWLPMAVYSAVIALVMITAAGPLRSDRPAGRPSAEA